MSRVHGGPVHHQAKGGRFCGCRSKANHGQLCLRQNSGRDLKDECHHHIGRDIRQNIRQYNAYRTVPGQFGQIDMIPVAEGHHLRPYRTGGPWPGSASDQNGHHHDSPLGFPYTVGDQDQQHKRRNHGKQIGKEHNQIIRKTAEISGKKPENQSQDGCNHTGNHPDLQ